MRNDCLLRRRGEVEEPLSVMRWLQLRFDGRSTRVPLLVKGHHGHSDVTSLAADPIATATLTYLLI